MFRNHCTCCYRASFCFPFQNTCVLCLQCCDSGYSSGFFYIFLFHLMKYYFKTLLGCNVDENILLSSMQLNSSSLVCFVEIFLEESVLYLGKTKAIACGKRVLIISYPRKDGENNKIQSIFYKFKVSLLCHCQQWMSPKGFLLLLN